VELEQSNKLSTHYQVSLEEMLSLLSVEEVDTAEPEMLERILKLTK
jgi:hypothetical protein